MLQQSKCVVIWRCTNNCVGLQLLLIHAHRTCSVHPGEKEPNKSRNQARPDWVAALIQQQTDHLSPLWSPYKSSTFPLFSSAAHKFIKLAFPCCFWQKVMREGSRRCITGGPRPARTGGPTRPASTLFSLGSTTKLLLSPEWYMCSVCSQLNKCWGITHLAGLHFHQHTRLLLRSALSHASHFGHEVTLW